MAVISGFSGNYAFLSNFYPSKIVVSYLDILWPCLTAEHAFQLHKAVDINGAMYVLNAPTPGQAKRRGRRIPIREDWDRVKLWIMRDILQQKFSQEPYRTLLLETEQFELIETNNWGDAFWGVCNGKGENHLGQLIMEVRANLRFYSDRQE